MKQSASSERCTRVDRLNRTERPALAADKIQGVKELMKLLRLTAKPSTSRASAGRTARHDHAQPPAQLVRTLTAALLAGILAAGSGSPAFAQDPGQSPPPQEQQQRPPL